MPVSLTETYTPFEKHVHIPNRNIYPVRKTCPYPQPPFNKTTHNMTVIRPRRAVYGAYSIRPYNRGHALVGITQPYFDGWRVPGTENISVSLTETYTPFEKHGRIPNHHPTKLPITRPSFGPAGPSVGRIQYAPTTGDTP